MDKPINHKKLFGLGILTLIIQLESNNIIAALMRARTKWSLFFSVFISTSTVSLSLCLIRIFVIVSVCFQIIDIETFRKYYKNELLKKILSVCERPSLIEKRSLVEVACFFSFLCFFIEAQNFIDDFDV